MLEKNTQSNSILKTQELSKSFVSNVFSMMFVALGITAITAYWFANSGIVITGITHWIIMLAPLGLVLLMGTRFTKLSAPILMSIFILFSVLMGMSLSYVFLAYDLGTISSTFFITAGTFGTMAILGYTTSTDLTKFGSILYMALIGIIIASVVNWFMGSDQLDYIISIAGVLIFTGLTAYDVQKIKRIGSSTQEGETKQKLVIMGALTLYLDFINLFLFILRIFGRD
ncbi:Bax inhibitor-1/YccA family protein [Flavobacteriales bacterium]|nr:Bax inhibitor-1/YccA family protein [Flavobacteriales bacterium]